MNNYQDDRRMVNNAVGFNDFLTKMYGWMSLAVLISAATAYFMSSVFGIAGLMQNRWLMWGSLLVWFFMPFVITSQAMKRPSLSFIFLMLYAMITGVMFSSIFLTYTGTSIVAAFLSSAAIFITMTLFGLTTKRDLTKWGTQASAALIALIVAMIINMFLRSSIIAFVFSVIAIVIFTILTASDTQRMKNIYNQANGQVSTTGLAVIGALQLYLDFVNLFSQMLSIFGLGDNRD
ncbi:Bax inhibitor-1/YccA family protein [Lentilactobacillus kribbianus]|uniref:Bax inhibitor-1/YccA family protein n=1 Tax=Lentilactobacillus kribbianus TaxID=2729622 RepID=UPI00155760E5|nr:Bax inhibitor-1/YccA family protein [Lentilactobacillus kribbianus]